MPMPPLELDAIGTPINPFPDAHAVPCDWYAAQSHKQAHGREG